MSGVVLLKEKQEQELTEDIKAPKGPPVPDAVPAPEGLTEIIEPPYENGQDNFNDRRRFVFELDIHNVVFSVWALGILAFTLLTLMFQKVLVPFFTNLRDGLTANLDWFFLNAGNIFVLPWGRIRLGG